MQTLLPKKPSAQMQQSRIFLPQTSPSLPVPFSSWSSSSRAICGPRPACRDEESSTDRSAPDPFPDPRNRDRAHSTKPTAASPPTSAMGQAPGGGGASCTRSSPKHVAHPMKTASTPAAAKRNNPATFFTTYPFATHETPVEDRATAPISHGQSHVISLSPRSPRRCTWQLRSWREELSRVAATAS